MKFAVHWAPPVKVITPGWTAADEAGAHAEAEPASASNPATATSAVASIKRNLTVILPEGSRYAAPFRGRAKAASFVSQPPCRVNGAVSRETDSRLAHVGGAALASPACTRRRTSSAA